MAFDLDTGWDFFNFKHRREFWRVLKEEDPDLLVMTPECKFFSPIMNLNTEKMSEETLDRGRAAGMAMFQFCVQVAEEPCLQLGGNITIVELGGIIASSWHLVSWGLFKQR